MLLGGVFEYIKFKDKTQVSDETECTSGDELGATLFGDDGYGEDESEADEIETVKYRIMLKVSFFCFKMASGSKGQIPHFAKPDLMLGIENDFSKGDFRKFSLSNYKILRGE